jgi:nucleoid-associated protein
LCARGYGDFNGDNVNYPFSASLKDYWKFHKNFITFTQTAMTILEAKVSGAQLATGGYILFTDYVENGRGYLIVASIKHRPGLAFDANLNLTGAMHIDLEKLHEMARIEVTSWLGGGSRYLSFAKRRTGGDGFSDYFSDFIGCEEIANSTQMNTLTLQAIKAFGIDQKLDADQTKNLRAVVFNYFEEKRVAREPISLTMLSQRLDEDHPEAFLTFINDRSDEYPIGDGFDPVKSIYKRLKTFYMIDKTLKIQFDQKDFGTRVLLTDDGNLLVRGLNPEFLEELREFEDNG